MKIFLIALALVVGSVTIGTYLGTLAQDKITESFELVSDRNEAPQQRID